MCKNQFCVMLVQDLKYTSEKAHLFYVKLRKELDEMLVED